MSGVWHSAVGLGCRPVGGAGLQWVPRIVRGAEAA